MEKRDKKADVKNEKYYHCNHEKCVKPFKYTRDHKYNTHKNDGYSPVYKECEGLPNCKKCIVYCK